MKKLATAFALLCAFMLLPLEKAAAQDESPIKIKVVREKDGKKEVIEKTYKSKEEMANDPDLEGIEVIHLDSTADHTFSWKSDSSKNIKVFVTKSDDADGNVFISEGHVVKFDSDGGTFEFKTDDGDSANVFVIRRDDKTMELGNAVEWESEDGNVIILKGDKKEKVHVMRDKTAKQHVWVQRDVRRAHFGSSVSLEEATTSDILAANYTEGKTLVPASVEYTVDAVAGQLSLKFTAKSSPVKVSIRDTTGKQVFEENVDPFNGTYHSNIDISGQSPGTYILEIRQGQKSLYKKLVVQ